MSDPFDIFPKSYKLDFLKEVSRLNFYHSRKLALILFYLNFYFLYSDYVNYREGLWVPGSISGYSVLFYLHAFLGLMMLAFLGFSYMMRRKPQKTRIRLQNLLGVLFPMFTVLYSACVSINDQRIHGQISVFILGSFLIAINNYLNPKLSVVIHSLSWLTFISGVTYFQPNIDILKGHYINGTILVVFSVYLSTILYRMKRNDFISRKTIEQKNYEVEAFNNDLIEVNNRLEESLQALDESQNVIFTLASALESKDTYTRGHSERVAEYSLQIAQKLSLSLHEQQTIWQAAQLHDIGKIGIPDAILNKPGKLSEAEWAVMKAHPGMGENICSTLSFACDFLPLIRHHHERFDGTGYPDGLRGEEIPFLARIIAVADAVDAITSKRSYRSSETLEFALEELTRGKGSQFDPKVVEVFIESLQLCS